MKIAIPNGAADVEVDVPDRHLAAVIYPRELPALEDVPRAARQVIENPIGSPRLRDIARPRQKVTFLCDNWNRPIKHYELVMPALEELKAAGVRDDDIRFVIGNGVHRGATKPDILKLFGPELVERYGIANNVRDSRFKFIGVTPTRATPVWAHEWVADADMTIGLGTLGFNPAAGFGGGAKIICPGAVSYDTICYNHRLAISPTAVAGNIASPMRADAEEMIPMVNFKFIINAVYNKDGKAVEVVAGDPIAAHRVGAKTVWNAWCQTLPDAVDILIVGGNPRHTAEGAPITDISWATKLTMEVIKKGGTLIILHRSPWPEHPICHRGCPAAWRDECELMFMHTKPPAEKVLLDAHQGKLPLWRISSMVDIVKFMETGDMYLVNEYFKPHHLAGSGFKYAESVEDALAEALKKYGPDAKIGVVPYGGRMTYLTTPAFRRERVVVS